MTQLRKFLALSPAERSLLGRVWLLVFLIRLLLWVVPFTALRRVLTRWSTKNRQGATAVTAAERVGWAVTVASRYVPGASCLTQALAAQTLLRRRGHPSRLHLGVNKTAAGQFQAHAWVSLDDNIIIGGVDSPQRFTMLAELDLESHQL